MAKESYLKKLLKVFFQISEKEGNRRKKTKMKIGSENLKVERKVVSYFGKHLGMGQLKLERL